MTDEISLDAAQSQQDVFKRLWLVGSVAQKRSMISIASERMQKSSALRNNGRALLLLILV